MKAPPSNAAGDPVEKLTPREIEVLKLIANGFSTKRVASTLGITFKTASCHRSRLMEKLSIHDVSTLTRYALQHGYLELQNEGSSKRPQAATLFEHVKQTAMAYREATCNYAAFLEERKDFGAHSPDGITGARRFREIEKLAFERHYEALIALRVFLECNPTEKPTTGG